MSSRESTTAVVPVSGPVRRFFSRELLRSGLTVAVIALGACWLLFFNELRGEWQINPQYNFGWVVPMLGIALFWRRWLERPAARPPSSASPVAIVAVSLLLFQLPLRVVLEANPEWRLLYWIHGTQVLGLSVCLLYGLGGWAWVRFLTPPLLFMLVAVPWPMGLETLMIQGLMKFVAALTVEGAGWLGIPAVQRGNLIEVGVGIVGIDEACSGVNSLQSALMISLFLGEQHRFTISRRVALLVGSIGFVLLANLTRTTFLVWAAANRGLKQMEAWHDTAGLLVMAIVLSGMFALAWWMKPRATRVSVGASVDSPVGTLLPRWVGIAVLAWLAVVAVTTEIWYRVHESNLVDNPRWSVAWPVQNPQFKKTVIPEKSLAILRCSNSDAAAWEDEEGNQWSAFVLRWNPGKNSAQLAKGHRPDICFPATGARLADDFGLIAVESDGVAMTFRHQTFESGPRLLHVFHCLWSDRVSSREKPLLEDGSQGSRIDAVMAGERNLGQQVFEVVVQGPDSSDAAVALFKSRFPLLVKRS
ncbi:MAG: exosortase/archaeosortase family protein [Opitutaceae bacterium]|nr:exosortase/archaeosortase family protein [Verrucomicrobiales bacterium]